MFTYDSKWDSVFTVDCIAQLRPRLTSRNFEKLLSGETKFIKFIKFTDFIPFFGDCLTAVRPLTSVYICMNFAFNRPVP